MCLTSQPNGARRPRRSGDGHVLPSAARGWHVSVETTFHRRMLHLNRVRSPPVSTRSRPEHAHPTDGTFGPWEPGSDEGTVGPGSLQRGGRRLKRWSRTGGAITRTPIGAPKGKALMTIAIPRDKSTVTAAPGSPPPKRPPKPLLLVPE